MMRITEGCAITATEKILDILLLCLDRDGEVTIDAISSALDIPRSTAYRYTRTLTEKGFLHKADVSGVYRLGRIFLGFSQMVANDRTILLAVMPAMVNLAIATGESVSLMRLINRHAVCLESIPGSYALRIAIERGRAQPLHAGASSRVLLANQPPDTWKSYLDFPLAHYTDTTITDWERLKDNLYAVRERGYAVSEGEIDVGAWALAVPLRNMFDSTIAALSIEAPVSRIDEQKVKDYVAHLQQASTVIEFV
ncbi:MAG: IclR family transcriptional regulator [Chloroflexota bacterium]